MVFRTFHRPRKGARVTRHSSAPAGRVHPRWALVKWLRAVRLCLGARMSVRRGATKSSIRRSKTALAPRFLAPAHHGSLPVGATVGVVAVEVPQIQFLDDEMVGYWRAWFPVSTVDTWSASAPGCFRTVSPYFLCEGMLRS